MAVYSSAAVFLFFAVALVIPSGFSLGAALLLLGGLALPGLRQRLHLQKDDLVLIAVLTLYFVAGVILNLVHAAPGREYDAPLRFALAIPALLFLLAYPPRAAALWAGLALGAIGAGAFTGWENLMTGNTRAGGYTNPIQYGNISLVLGVFCLAGLAWARRQNRAVWWNALLLAGAGAGLLGSLFTGSRGSWIALPFCLLVLHCYYGHRLDKRRIRLALLAACLAFAALYAIPRTGLQMRLQEAMTEAQKYAQTRDAGTSTGARLEMWRTGLILFHERPWLGWGKQGYMARTKELVADGAVHPITQDHNHLHNEYLDALIKRGVPGLAATLLLFLAPFFLFIRRAGAANRAALPYAAAGVMLCVAYSLFGLTQAFLTHNNGVMIFAFSLTVFWAMLREHEVKPPLQKTA